MVYVSLAPLFAGRGDPKSRAPIQLKAIPLLLAAAIPGPPEVAFVFSRMERRGFAALNKTSIKPDVYGERFVKRRGLFSV